MGKILIAEDNESIAEGLKVNFSYDGHDVHIACDGQKAVESYMDLHPDLLITDFDMPRKTGLEVTKEVIRYDPNAKIIIYSGSISKDIALGAGALALISKDKFDELEEKVKELLNK